MLLTQTSPPLEKTHTSNPLSRYGSVCMFDVANTNYSPLSENPHLEPRFPDARRSARESPPLIGSPRKLPGMMLRTKITLCSVTCRVSATTTHPATLRKGLDEDALGSRIVRHHSATNSAIIASISPDRMNFWTSSAVQKR